MTGPHLISDFRFQFIKANATRSCIRYKNMNVTAIISCVVETDIPYVHDAIRSIQQQTHPCQIIIVVSEATAKIQASIQSLGIDAELELVPLCPVGITRNLGVQRASTEWVAFLDADDIWLPRKTELQLAYALKNDCPAVGSRHVLARNDKTPFFYGFARKIPMPSSWLVKRDLMLQEPFSDVKAYEDGELWRRFNRRIRTWTLREYLIYYRVHAAHVSSPYPSTYTRSYPKRRKEWFARAARNPVLRMAFLCLSRAASFCYLPIQPPPS